MALLALFIAIAFFGILLHINRMVFGRADEPQLPRTGTVVPSAEVAPLPRTCFAMLLVGGALVILVGLYLPSSIDHLLRLASGASAR